MCICARIGRGCMLNVYVPFRRCSLYSGSRPAPELLEAASRQPRGSSVATRHSRPPSYQASVDHQSLSSSATRHIYVSQVALRCELSYLGIQNRTSLELFLSIFAKVLPHFSSSSNATGQHSFHITHQRAHRYQIVFLKTSNLAIFWL